MSTRACPSVVGALVMALLLSSCGARSSKVTAVHDTELRENATWSGTVRLFGEVVVPEGVTLTVKAGTQIVVVEPWDAKITVNGRLYMRGRKRRPVRVHGGEKGIAWAGISFVGPETEGVVEYCEFVSQSHVAIACDGASPTIRSNRFYHGPYASSVVCMNGSRALVEGNSFVATPKRRGRPAAVLVVNASPQITRNHFGSCQIGVHVSALQMPRTVLRDRKAVREYDAVPPDVRPTVSRNAIGPDGIVYLDERDAGTQAWREVFREKDIHSANFRKIEVEGGRDGAKVTVHTHPVGFEPDEAGMNRYALSWDGERYVAEHDVVADSPPPIDQWPFWTSSWPARVNGQECLLLSVTTVLGRLRRDGCRDTPATYVLLARRQPAGIEVLWRSPKFDPGRALAASADVNGDGREEIVVSTGAGCSFKGDITVFEQADR